MASFAACRSTLSDEPRLWAKTRSSSAWRVVLTVSAAVEAFVRLSTTVCWSEAACAASEAACLRRLTVVS
jgi:hypothetical protein